MDAEMVRGLHAGETLEEEVGARTLTPALVSHAELVLCMTRAERREVVRAAPQGLCYTYALADFSDVATKMNDTPADPAIDAELEGSAVRHVARTAVLHRDEVHARLGDHTDVAVPSGGGSSYQHAAQELRELLAPVITVLGQVVAATS